MKVLLSWLQEFAPDITGDPATLGETLSDLGLAVDDMTLLGEGLDGILVAEVLATRPHPDADRIQLVDVDTGDGEALQVCCGAFNMSVGDRVPLATVGTVMPNGMEIAKRKMRGQWSNGMLCSAAELGLGDDAAGILLLDGTPALGTPLAQALNITRDVLWDLEVNPNRPDAMSVMGVARDLAARLQVPFTVPQPQPPTSGQPAEGRISVQIADPHLCGRFGARVLDNITVGTSPTWLTARLRAVGQRPINSIVDISNYVMFELGQPNHTYDLDLVPDGHLGVRMARPGEHLVTLDGVERELSDSDGVIVDRHDRPVGLAGVMGGASTEISASTRSVLLEAAWWDPMTIARTSRRLGLRSEASARFERGVDPELAPLAMDRFAELAAGLGATCAPGAADEHGNTPERLTVRVRPERVNSILGTTLEPDHMAALLAPIGFDATTDETTAQDLHVRIPSWRLDSATEIDIIEEVGRMFGYTAIARTMPVITTTGGLTHRQRDRRTLRSHLVGMGISETMPLPFLAPGDLQRAGLGDDGIRLTNPLVAEESVMRTSLRPGLLKAVAYNAARRTTGVRLFEIGRVHPGTGGDLPDEHEHLAVILAGQQPHEAVQLWRRLARIMTLAHPGLRNAAVPGLHPGRSAELLADGQVIGAVGEIDPHVLESHEITERVTWLEADLDALCDAERHLAPYRAPSRYPSSDIDLAFTVPDEVPADHVAATLRVAAGDLLATLNLFDVFRSENLPENHRSLAFALRFEAPDRTLTDAEVGQIRQTCIDAVVTAHDATLRG